MNEAIMKMMGFSKEVERVKAGLCPMCEVKVDADEFTNDINEREFKISGLCQYCQDAIFGGER